MQRREPQALPSQRNSGGANISNSGHIGEITITAPGDLAEADSGPPEIEASAAVHRALVRIHDRKGRPVGAGCLVGPEQIVTCLGVLTRAVARPALGDIVTVSFASVPEERLETEVVCLPPSPGGGSHDVVGLAPRTELPGQVKPVRLAAPPLHWDDRFHVLGISRELPEGLWASGRLKGAIANRVEIEWQDAGRKAPEPSGGPAWAENSRSVVGICAGAYLLPTSSLVSAWPVLERHSHPANPFRGLSAFREEDAALFKGRDGLSEELADQVRRSRLVTVVGPSGCGKSSLLSAGLVPRLRGARRRTAMWRPQTGGSTRNSLAAAVVNSLDVAASEQGHLAAAADFLKADPYNELVVILDQIEEVLVREDGGHEFDEAVTELLEIHPRVRVVLGLRSDFLDHLLRLPSLNGSPRQELCIVSRMSREELLQVINEPLADPAMPKCQDGLAELIADDAGEKAVPLPLVEFVLTLLWESLHDQWLTHDEYRRLGGVAGVIADHAEHVWAHELDASDHEEARRILLHLVVTAEDNRHTGRSIPLGDLSPEQTRLAQRLASHRLLTVDQNTDGTQVIHLAHEAIITHWKRLSDWIAEDRPFWKWRDDLRHSVDRWQEDTRSGEHLLRGRRLRTATAYYRTRKDDLSPSECAYIKASVSARRRRGYLRGMIAAALATVLVVVGTYWERQQGAMQDLEASTRSTKSDDLLRAAQDRQTSPSTAILLAVAAHRISSSPSTQGFLHYLYRSYWYAERFLPHSSHSVDVDHNGTRLLTVALDNRVHLLDLREPDASPVKLVDDANEAAISGNGKVAVVAHKNGQISLWDLRPDQPRRLMDFPAKPSKQPDTSIFDVRLDNDGSTLAYAYYEGSPIYVTHLDGKQAGYAVPRRPQPKFSVNGEPLRFWLADDGDSLLTEDQGIVEIVSEKGTSRRALASVTKVLAIGPKKQIVTCADHADTLHLSVWDWSSGSETAHSSLERASCTDVTAQVSDTAILTTLEMNGPESHEMFRTVTLWEPRSNRVRARFPIPTDTEIEGIYTGTDGAVRLVARTNSDAFVMRLPRTDEISFAVAAAESTAFAPDGTLIAWDLDEGELSAWHPESGKPAGRSGSLPVRGTAPFGTRAQLAVSPDSRMVAIAEGAAPDGRIHVWDLRRSALIASVPVPLPRSKSPVNLGFTAPDTLLVEQGGEAVVWDVAADRRKGSLSLLSKAGAAASLVRVRPGHPELVAIWADGTAQWWNTDTGKLNRTEHFNIAQITGPNKESIIYQDFTFDDSGRYFVSTTPDKSPTEDESWTVTLWDLDQNRHTAHSFSGRIYAADVTAGPLVILQISVNEAQYYARWWPDQNTLDWSAVLIPAMFGEFASDGRWQIDEGFWDAPVLFPVDDRVLRERLCRFAGGSLTADEIKKYRVPAPAGTRCGS